MKFVSSSYVIKFIIAIFLFFQSVGRASNSLNNELQAIATKYKNVSIGVDVIELQGGKRVSSLNENQPLNPASVAKIVTAISALDFLRPEYTFKTRFFTNGVRKGKELHGDLFVKAGGDPVFVTEYMYLLADELAREGFSTVEGNIVFDLSFFIMGPDENVSDFQDNQAYNALVSPLVFNFNTTTIYVKPGSDIGAALNVIVDPENAYIKINNSGITSKNNYSLSISKGKNDTRFETYQISGEMPYTSKERRFYKNIENPGFYFAQVLKDFLLQKGILVKGTLVNGTVPENVKLLSVKESRALGYIIKDLFTFSNNVLAENIVRTMGHEFKKDENSENAGLSVIKKYMSSKAGVDLNNVVLHKASGLSRKNRICASDINKVILAGKKDFTIYPEFLNALCVSGTTGTLKEVFKGVLKEKIRAKTGSLNGVASLSGIYNGKEKEYIFTILVNSNALLDLRGIVREIMEKIGEKL